MGFVRDIERNDQRRTITRDSITYVAAIDRSLPAHCCPLQMTSHSPQHARSGNSRACALECSEGKGIALTALTKLGGAQQQQEI